MKLPSFSFFSKKEKSQYYLALLLRDEKVTAVIFEELLGRVTVIGSHEEEFSDSIETVPLEEWLEVLDKAISQAESRLPQNVETQKTIFGVKEDWVFEKQIKKEYLAKLKKVSDELGLTPIGFLVIPEAIAHFLGKEEGVPVSAILIEVGKQKIAVSLLRAGRVLETKRTRVEDTIAETTDRILHHFTSYEVLPSRIILFNSKNGEDLSQKLIGHSWSKSLPFLHVPQITTLPAGFDAQSIIFGAASEMGFEVLDSLPVETPLRPSEAKALEDSEEQVKETETTMQEESATENFGFVIDKDVSKQSIVPVPTLAEQPKESVAKKIAPPVFEKVKPLILNAIALISTIRVPHIWNMKKRKMVFIPPLILLFCILLLFLYVMGIKAQVILKVKPMVLEKNQEVTFSTSNATDFTKNLISSESLVVSADGSLSTPATGTKEIGEKAKGSVTIYNNSLESKTFPKDSSIKSTNDLEFTLDESITIASASGDASSPSPTSKKVSVTAKDIGKEYNLPSGTKFTIGTFPVTTVVAKNESAFSGGSKKEVTAVAKGDLDKLTSELPKSLEKQAKEEMTKKVSQDKEILPNFANTTLSKKTFDKNAGEEAKSVKLTASVSYQTIAYKKSDLESFAKNFVTQNAKDMTFSGEDISIEVKNIKEKDNKEITATVYTKATLLPAFDYKKLSDSISGKSFQDAKDFLIKMPRVSEVDFVMRPSISFLPKMLPRRAQNISFEVTRND